MSHCNEQIFKFSQQNLQIQHLEPQQQQQKQAKLIKRESQRSLIIDSTKAASYEAISASEKTKSTSKSKKSAQVRKISLFCTL